MSAPEPNRHIVRPFGLIGGKYEVDDVGHLKYRIAWAIAVVVIVIQILRDALDLPAWVNASAAALCLITVMGLCVDIVRKGRKL